MNLVSAIISCMLLLHGGEALECYTCLFPTISPMDCPKMKITCAPKEQCLISTATGRRGDFQFVLKERSCTVSSLCGTSGQKNTLGFNVTFRNTCCDIDLCNSAPLGKATLGLALLPPLLPLLLAL